MSVDNLGAAQQSGLSVEAKVYAVGGQLLDDQTASGISVGSQGVARDLIHPVVPAATDAADAGADLLRRAAADARR